MFHDTGQLKGSPYSITECRILIPVLGSQHAGDVSHKPGGRLPLLSTRPAVTLARRLNLDSVFFVFILCRGTLLLVGHCMLLLC